MAGQLFVIYAVFPLIILEGNNIIFKKPKLPVDNHMTRTPVSTLKVRAVFTTFISVVLLTLLAVVPRMFTGFSNYLNSGTSIFLPFMEPINLFWFLPTQFQFLTITLQQFADICIFALISNTTWALLYKYYMKIKKNIAFQTEMTDQFGNTPFSLNGPINLLKIDITQKPLIGVRHADNLEFSQNNGDLQCNPPVDHSYDAIQERHPCVSTKALIKRTFSSLSLKSKYSKSLSFSNSAIGSLGFDFFCLAPPVWDSVSNFSESVIIKIGGQS